jgi:hypothetical protein
MEPGRYERGVDMRALLAYVAAVSVGSFIASFAPVQLLEILPNDPVWVRPACGVAGFALVLVVCIFVAHRLQRRDRSS